MAKRLSALDWYRKLESGPAFGRVAAYIVTKTTVRLNSGYEMAPITFNAQGGDDLESDPASSVETKWGKILVAYPADGAGIVHVFAWDCDGNGIQHGSATGYGYDKVSAAIAGMTWDGIELTDHPENWEMTLKKHGYTVYRAI